MGTGSGFTGSGTLILNAAEDEITINATHDIPDGNVTNGHIHLGAAGVGGEVAWGFTDGGKSPVLDTFPITPAEVVTLKAEGYYVNIHTSAFGGGEIRGQIVNQAPPGGGGGGDFVVWRGYEGADDLVGSRDWGCCGSTRSVVADAPPGGGENSLEVRVPADHEFSGFGWFVGAETDTPYDASAFSFLNFYMKAPDSAASYTFMIRDQTEPLDNIDAPPNAVLTTSALNAFPNFVANEWFYVSLPFRATGNDGEGPASHTWNTDFSRFTQSWIFSREQPDAAELVFNIDHVTFSTTPEAGMLGGGGGEGPELNAVSSIRGVAGASVCYDVTNAGSAAPGSFTWTFDDGQGGGAVTLEGEEDGQLCFNPLTEAHAGTYVASFNDGSKVENTFTLILEVLPEGTPVPASTNWTLFITMLATALCAGIFFGRKAIRQ